MRSLPEQRDKLPFRFVCDKWDCYWACSFSTSEELDYWTINHLCAKNARNYMTDVTDENGQPYTKPWHGQTVGEKLWTRLDAIMDVIKSGDWTGADRAAAYGLLKGEGSGISFCLATMFPHFYDDKDAVTREALRRWKQTNIPGTEFKKTPGCNWNPIPQGMPLYGEQMKAMAASRAHDLAKKGKTSTPRSDPKAGLPEATKLAITNGLKMGFDPQQLALAYKVPLPLVESFRETTV